MMFALHMDTGEHLGYVLLDTILEFIPVIAVLFLSYLLMEWMEHRMGERAERAIAKAGPFAPAAGALLGCVPQCGFSAAAAGLYAGRVITLGTLYAVFFATSDEMLPIMLSAAFRGKFAPWSILRVIGGKLVIGTLVGMLVDLVLRLFRLATKRWHHGEEPENAAPHGHVHAHLHDHAHSHIHEDAQAPAAEDDTERVHASEEHSHDHEHHHEVGQIHELCERTGCHCEDGILKSALRHTVHIGVFLLIFSFLLNLLFHFIGDGALKTFLSGRGVLTCFLASLVGLIPSCAASLAVTELYLAGAISVGALYAGLLTGAGVGVLVLCRLNRPVRETVFIVIALYLMGALVGLLIDGLSLGFLGLKFS